MTNTPFTQMLAELNVYLGNRKIMPRDTNDIAAMTDDGKNPDLDGGMELPGSGPAPEEVETMVGDLDDDSDLSSLSIDQIIGALLAIKQKMAGTDGGAVDPDAASEQDPNDPMASLSDLNGDTSDKDGQDQQPGFPGQHNSVTADPDGQDVEGDDENINNPMSGVGLDDNGDPLKKNSDGLDPTDDPDAIDPSLDADQTDPDQDGAPTYDNNTTGSGGPDVETDELGNPKDPAQDAANAIDGGASGEPDPNRVGTIRAVKGAHLVYKRQNGEGTYEELWIYNIGEHINDTLEVKRAIIAGTDIPDDKLRSEDGTQSYELTTMGNAQLLKVSGLPN